MNLVPRPNFLLPPPYLLLLELISASAAVGCTSSASWLRSATLPVLSACAYGIIRDGTLYMRPRWASLLGGFSVAVLLRYFDIGLISRWNFEDRGPAKPQTEPVTHKDVRPSTTSGLLARLQFGWQTLWSFRQVNTPYEVKNVPGFRSSEPSYVPTRWTFVCQQAVSAVTCYILLDLLGQRPPPSNRAQFNSTLIPVFSRLQSVSAAELKLRALTITGFGVTFFLVIQGFISLAATTAVGTGLSPVESWRPAFGSIWDAYSLKTLWGYVFRATLAFSRYRHDRF
jgi:hypothetical protein